MTAGPAVTRDPTVTRGTMLDSVTKNDPNQNISVKIEETNSTDTNASGKLKKRPEDRVNDKVINEDFRQAAETMLKGIADLPKNWQDLTIREQRDWLTIQLKREFTNVPETLIFLCVGSVINDDNERFEHDPRPDWLDHEKFLRGQRFVMENYAGASLAQLLSLYLLFSFENGLKPIVMTGKSSDPFTSFKRYLSTIKRIKNWYSTDVWTRGTNGYRDMMIVRKMHSNVRKRLINSTEEDIVEASTIKNSWSNARFTLMKDFHGSCPAAEPGQCPYVFSEDDKFKVPKGMNQMEMAITQCGFVSLLILFPEYFGIHGSTDEELDAFCHIWRSYGYLLGIEDEFNFCAGTLQEVQQRSRDFLEYWVKPNLRDVTPEWEHMLRCLMEGVRFYFPSMTYEHGMLYIAEMLDIPMPQFKASMSYGSWIHYHITKGVFYWTTKLPGVPKIMSYMLNASVERALKFTDKQLEVLKEKSNNLMAKGIAETVAAKRQKELERQI